MHILIHTVSCSGLVFVQRLQREGHDVSVLLADEDNMFVANTKDPSYDGMVHKWPNLKQALESQPDLLVFDMMGEGKDKIIEMCHAYGVPTLGADKYATKVELDRGFADSVMKEAGILRPPTYSFKDFNTAIKFVRKNPDRYVFKPNDNQTNYASYVSKSPDDLVNTMEHYHDEHLIDESKGFILQKFIEGFEISCYDYKTEILTNNGWKFFDDLKSYDSVATINPETMKIEYAVPEKIIRQTYNGDMYLYETASINFCVTPNHRMLQKTRYDYIKHKDKPWEFKTVEECYNSVDRCYFPRSGVWEGTDCDYFVLPGITKENGWRGSEDIVPISIDMDTWVEFMGWYLSEGCFVKHSKKNGYEVIITQKKGHCCNEIEKVLGKLPFKWDKNGINYRIYNKQLWNYVATFGRSCDKFVPDYIKNASKETIDLFCSVYLMGDGYLKDGEYAFYCTSSRQMADDLQELCLKKGTCASISRRDAFVDKRGVHHPDMFIVADKCYMHGTLEHKNYKKVPYNDIVYCVKVLPNRTVYVRREGKAMWCGNTELWHTKNGFIPNFVVHDIEEKKFLVGNLGPTTGCMGSLVWIHGNMDDILVQNVMKMGPVLRKYGYVGPVDINTIVSKEDGKPYALEFCHRFGYVCIENTMELLKSNFGDLLYAVAIGKPYKPVYSTDFCIGIRLTIPPFPMTEIPEKTPDAKKKIITEFLENRSVGVRIIGYEKFTNSCYWDGVRQDEDREGLFSCNDILGSICATGKTIDEAKALVYDRLKAIDVPDKQYRTDIGDRGKEWFKMQNNRKLSEPDYDDQFIAQLLYSEERKILRGR